MLALLLAAITLAPTPPAPSFQAEEDGARAPANTWPSVGGNAARTGRTHTRPVRTTPELAWTFDAPGLIESEPLVWKNRALLSCLTGDDERTLLWFDLDRGRVIDKAVIDSDVSLEPSMWRDRIVFRVGKQEMHVYSTRRDKLQRARRTELPEGPISAPLLVEDACYLRAGESLVRIRPMRQTPDWVVGRRLRGEIAVRGNRVCVVSYDQNGNARLETYDRKNGDRMGRANAGYHRGSIPRLDRGPSLQLLNEQVLVIHDRRVGQHPEYGQLRTAFFADREATKRMSDWAHLFPVTLPVVTTDGGWFAYIGSPIKVLAEIEPSEKGGQYQILANEELHREMLVDVVPPSRARDVIYAGGTAIDAVTHEVLWRVDAYPRFRAVPVDRGVLYVSGDRAFSLYREPTRESTPGQLFAQPNEAGVSKFDDATLASLSGQVTLSDLRFETDEGTVVLGSRKKADSLALAEVALALSQEGELLYASSETDAVLDGIDDIARAQQADEIATLAFKARTARDPDLMAELVARARSLGAEGSNFEKAEKELEKLEKKKDPKPNAKKVAAMRAALLECEETRTRALARLTTGLPAGVSSVLRLGLLRAQLERGEGVKIVDEVFQLASDALPSDGPALEFLEGILTRDQALGSTEKALEWIAYLQASALYPVAFRTPLPPDHPDLTFSERLFGKVSLDWRPDLVCAETERLWIMTPLTRPGALAQGIVVGELVGRALEELFVDEELVEREILPMGMLLYENKEEYLERTSGNLRERRLLENSAGHYVPGENVQHIYMPEREDAFPSVLKTYAHELTHNWTDMRCPLFTREDQKLSVQTHGFWIVEGFADFVAGFKWDLERGTYEVWNPRVRYLDVVANTEASDLVPWDELYNFDQIGAQGLSPKPEHEVQLTWRLGVIQPVSEIGLFYNQSAATCAWLWHGQDGKHRHALAQMIRAYYTATGEVSLPTILGISAERIGQQVAAFAKNAVRGGD